MPRILGRTERLTGPRVDTETIDGVTVAVTIADESGKVAWNRAHAVLLAEAAIPRTAALASAVATERVRLRASAGPVAAIRVGG